MKDTTVTPFPVRQLPELPEPVFLTPNYIPPTDEEWERLAAVEGLRNLAEKYGYQRVGRWLRSLAAIHGIEV